MVPRRMIECGLATNGADSNIRAAELIRASVDRARAAIIEHEKKAGKGNRQRMIAGCVPPLTECYFSRKVPTSVSDLTPEYTTIISTLLDCEVDILLAETLSTTREALAILRSIFEFGNKKIGTQPTQPIWISFTVHDDRPTKLRSDESLETACKTIIQEASSLDLPLEAIGVNCSSPDAICCAVPVLVNIVEGSQIKVCAYGNCFKNTTSSWMRSLDEDAQCAEDSCATDGLKQTRFSSEDFDEEGYLLPDVYAKCASEFVRSGAKIVGGCCGSRPKHMCRVVSALRHQR
mmetsp:Transcript_21098/g.36287  ORF Transcript_21098/g.36287 Transcript_21098/m.36287 type:complete len:291 (+) Transcript_21098:139-1011(+)